MRRDETRDPLRASIGRARERVETSAGQRCPACVGVTKMGDGDPQYLCRGEGCELAGQPLSEQARQTELLRQIAADLRALREALNLAGGA